MSKANGIQNQSIKVNYVYFTRILLTKVPAKAAIGLKFGNFFKISVNFQTKKLVSLNLTIGHVNRECQFLRVREL